MRDAFELRVVPQQSVAIVLCEKIVEHAVVADDKQARIDAFYDAAHATYNYRAADGSMRTTTAPPEFRMVGGIHDPPKQLLLDVLGHQPQLQSAINMSSIGKATPAQVAMVTQALIDAGKLEIGPGEDPTHAVRMLMWKYGVGIDCSGYVQQAFLYCRNLDPLSVPARAQYGFAAQLYDEGLSEVPHSAHFQKIDPVFARPGDLMILGPPPGEPVGHTLVIRANSPLDSAKQAELSAANDDAAVRSFLAGDLRVFEVDASWGGGTTGEIGGVDRRTWLYEPATGKWADWAPPSAVTLSTQSGPYDHPLDGVFRPRNEV